MAGRLQDGIGKAEGQDVLNRFFAKVMVNAVDLTFVKDGMNLIVQSVGAFQVMPERFFDDDMRPAGLTAVQSGQPQLLDDGGIERGRRGQVEKTVTGCARRSARRR